MRPEDFPSQPDPQAVRNNVSNGRVSDWAEERRFRRG